MKLKFLGSGTSQGVPVIGCHCEVCTSKDHKDQRFRSSVLITTDAGKKILIDCGPDFRMQMLENNEDHVDALLLTHEHNDHVIGLDDMRPLIFRTRKDIPIYCSKRVGDEIKQRFPYAFAEVKYPGAPSFELYEIHEAFNLFDAEVTPVEVLHYQLVIFGFKFKNLVYITDASGDGRVVEYDCDDPARPLVDTPAAAATNFYALYPDRVKPNQRNGIYGHGRERYDTVLKILAQQKDVLSPLTVWDALRAVAQEPDSKDITSNTQWSICFHSSALSADVALRRHWDNIFRFRLTENTATALS